MYLTKWVNLYKYQPSRSFIDLGARLLRFNILKLLILRNPSPAEALFHVKPLWDGGMKMYSNSPGQLTNLVAMPIYGKNLKNLLLRNQKAMTLNVDMLHKLLKYY